MPENDYKKYPFIINAEARNRKGFIVKNSSLDFSEFLVNPQALDEHDRERPIGFWSDIRLVNGMYEAVLNVPAKSKLKHVTDIIDKLDNNLIRATSIYIDDIDYIWNEATDEIETTYAKVIEISTTSVQANPFTVAIKNGVRLACDAKLNLKTEKDMSKLFEKLGVKTEEEALKKLEDIQKIESERAEKEVQKLCLDKGYTEEQFNQFKSSCPSMEVLKAELMKKPDVKPFTLPDAVSLNPPATSVGLTNTGDVTQAKPNKKLAEMTNKEKQELHKQNKEMYLSMYLEERKGMQVEGR